MERAGIEVYFPDSAVFFPYSRVLAPGFFEQDYSLPLHDKRL